jgi:acyl-CoA synthetase (AMP-forming)/AMP-acid ligase II
MTYDDRPWLADYDEGTPHDVAVPEGSLLRRLLDVAEKFPDNPAIHFLGRTFTYADLMRMADRFALTLKDAGLKPGAVVGINLPNIPQYLIAQIGALKAGCPTSGVSPLMTARELEYQLRDCKAQALVTLDAIFEKRLRDAAPSLPDLTTVIAGGILDLADWPKRFLAKMLKKVPTGKVGSLSGKRVVTFKDALGRAAGLVPDPDFSPEDPCLVQYTGGTTGLPKGAVLTHRNLVANGAQIEAWIRPDYGKDVMLSGFPLFHLAGLAFGFAALSIGAAQVLIPNPRDTAHIVKELRRYSPTALVNVPSLYMMLLDAPGFDKLDFSRLGYALSGASPFPADSIRALEKVIGEGKVLEVYGMTETSPIITMNPRFGKKKIGSVGVPVPGTQVRIVDLETGTRPVPVGQDGELIVRGPQVMKGYLNRPEETRNALRKHDGAVWLHTGDVARMDEEGYFSIIDRAKDMLNVGGFKVFSREVEEKLYEHPAIDFCAIVGLPNPKRPGTDVVKLVVQLAPQFQRTDIEAIRKDILDFCRNNLSPYKVPKVIEVMDAIPLTQVGKVDKKALRKPPTAGDA